MNEFFLPVSLQPILETATNSTANTTPMDQSPSVDRCQMEKDALRGILVELKRGMKVMQERQDALHRCMTGRGLTDTSPIGDGYRFAADMLSGVAKMKWGLDQIAFTAGIKIE